MAEMLLTEEEEKIIEEHRKNKKHDFEKIEKRVEKFLQIANKAIDEACELEAIYKGINYEDRKKFEGLLNIKFLNDIAQYQEE